MTELEKLKAGLEYCYDDEEVDALKENAIKWCMKFNALDPLDFDGQREVLKENLGSMGEKVWIAKTFNCDNGKNIHIGNNFTGNYNLTILDIREVYIGDNVMIGPQYADHHCRASSFPDGQKKASWNCQAGPHRK